VTRPTFILVLRALGLGDALTAVPALRGIRRRWPGRWLLFAGDPRIGDWLRELRLVDEVLPSAALTPLDWPPASVTGATGHLAVNLHGRGPQSHQVLIATRPDRLIAFRQPSAGHPHGPDWRDDEHEVDRWCRLIAYAGGRCGRKDLLLPATGPPSGEVLMHPGAAAAARRWPTDRWAHLAVRLSERGYPVTLTGGPGETHLCDDIIARTVDLAGAAHAPGNLAGRLELPALAGRVAAARLLVCGDTGVAHLATAYRTRSVLLFGPTSPRRWGPAVDPDLHTVLWHGDDDHPGDPHGSTVDPALARIVVDEVLSAARSQLASRPTKSDEADLVPVTAPGEQPRQAAQT
jgi:ADP-heptose:LPS heptosyltransferase